MLKGRNNTETANDGIALGQEHRAETKTSRSSTQYVVEAIEVTVSPVTNRNC